MDKLAMTIAGEITLSSDPGGSMKKWREIFAIHQTELASHLKVSSSTISDYEGGRRKNPGIGVISRLVKTLIDIDKSRGGKVIKQLEKDFKQDESKAFESHEFSSGVKAIEMVRKINGNVICLPHKLKEEQIFGYTIIDSLKVILEVPVHEYMMLYGKTPNRALLFRHVENGRSPLIAVKVGRFSTDMKPNLIILHGDFSKKEVDPIAIKIAESEKIPLVTTNMPMEEIIKKLGSFEE
ncbi:MAG: transcriptional regulator [Candidatus ainarchaeum sp.]|nr:transcriptional regulator [Candidatus ainarchaeum sp.]